MVCSALILIWVSAICVSADPIVSISLNKVLHLQQSSFSVLDIIHHLDLMDESIFKSLTTLELEPSTIQANEKFDLFRGNQSQVACYLTNVDQIEYLYSRNRSCQENCSMVPTQSSISRYSEGFEGDNNETSINLIIDNSHFPCQEGTYFPQVDLFQQLKTTIIPNMTYFYLSKALLLVLILLLLLLGTTNSIMLVKYQQIRKQLAKSILKTKDMEKVEVIRLKIEENEIQEKSESESLFSDSIMRVN